MSDANSHVHLRVRMHVFGLWATYAYCLAGIAWLVGTWGQPHRAVLLVMTVGALLGTVALKFVDAELIMRNRRSDELLLAWSLGYMVLVAITVVLDGGAMSPAVGGFFIIVVFAALSYPLRSVAIIGSLNIVALVTAGAIGGTDSQGPGTAHLWNFAVCLAIVGAMCVFQARVQEERRLELAWLSTADPLTHALNRRGFAERVEAAISAAQRDATSVALLVLDLDHFKAVNDHQGHEAGDALLRDLVRAAMTAVRRQDAVGRLGGDEFAVLLPGSDVESAKRIADRIAAALPGQVGVSTGFARMPEDGSTSLELHRRADERLYEHKNASRAAALERRPDETPARSRAYLPVHP